MAYTAFSTRISSYLAREMKYPEEKREVLAYAVESLLLTIAGFILIMAVGFVLGVPVETFFAAAAGGLLRKASGGRHMSTPARCLATGALTYPPAALLASKAFNLWGGTAGFLVAVVVLSFACLAMIYRFAPVDSPAKPIVSPDFRKKLHRLSLFFAVVLLFPALFNHDTGWGVSIIGGLTLQSASLLPVLNKGGEKHE